MSLNRDLQFDSVTVYYDPTNIPEHLTVLNVWNVLTPDNNFVEVLITRPNMRTFIEHPETGKLIHIGGPRKKSVQREKSIYELTLKPASRIRFPNSRWIETVDEITPRGIKATPRHPERDTPGTQMEATWEYLAQCKVEILD